MIYGDYAKAVKILAPHAWILFQSVVKFIITDTMCLTSVARMLRKLDSLSTCYLTDITWRDMLIFMQMNHYISGKLCSMNPHKIFPDQCICKWEEIYRPIGGQVMAEIQQSVSNG